MEGYSVYDLNTGEIIFSCNSYDGAVSGSNANTGIIQGKLDDSEFYVPNGVVTPRPRVGIPENLTIAADNVDSFVLTAVPEGTTIRMFDPSKPKLDPQRYSTWTMDESETFEWSSTIPGTYTFEVFAPFPTRQESIKVTVQ